MLRVPAYSTRQREVRHPVGIRQRAAGLGSSGHPGGGGTMVPDMVARQDRIILKVKVDNVTALTLLVKMRPSPSTAHARQLALISRELALHTVGLSFPPDAAHIPGVGHIFADALSMVFAPTGKGKITPDLHPALATARVDEAPARDKSFYRITNFDNPASQIPPAAEEV